METVSNLYQLREKVLEFRAEPWRDKVEISQECLVDCRMVLQLALMSPILWPGFRKIRCVSLRALIHARSQIAGPRDLDFYSPWLGVELSA